MKKASLFILNNKAFLNRMLDKIFPDEEEKEKFLLKLEKKFHNYKKIK